MDAPDTLPSVRAGRKAAALLLIALPMLLGACERNDDAAEPSDGPTNTHIDASPDLGCPEQASAFRSDAASTTADVDGDGEADRVHLVAAAGDCSPVLVVETVEGISSRTIEEEASGPGLPRLVSLADVDGKPGMEPIVAVATGASTEFFAVFALIEGSLERLSLRGGQFGDLFPSGGSAGHLHASDCVGDGVVIASAMPQGDLFRLERRFFRPAGPTLRRSNTSRSLVDAETLGRIPVFASTPFGSCPQA